MSYTDPIYLNVMNQNAAPSSDGADTHVESTYNLHDLSVIIKNGEKISLMDVYTSIEIFEDIFSNSIHGFIELHDSYGGLEKYVLSGGELITLTILKPEPSTEILISRNDLMVHQISDIEAVNETTVKFKLYFAPLSSMFSQKKRIYRAYRNNKKISELIPKIYKDIGSVGELGMYEEKDVSISKNFLSPGYTPYEAINFLAKRASVSEKYHVFYERLNKMAGKTHIFGSINKISEYWNSGKLPLISYNAYANYITTENRFYVRAIKIEYQNNFNHLANMMSGLYNSRIRLIDPIKKTYSENILDYKQKSRITNDTVFERNNFFFNYENSYPEFPGERMSISALNDPQSNKALWVINDTYGTLDMSLIRANVDISGGSNDIGTGNLIDLRVPSSVTRFENLNSGEVEDDIIYSGIYMVTAVRHIISRTNYIKKMEVSRSAKEIIFKV